MSQFETICRNLVAVKELNQLTERNSEAFSERLDTLKVCWQDNAGQSFCQRQVSATIYQKDLLQVAVSAFLGMAERYTDSLQQVEQHMSQINTEFIKFEEAQHTIQSIIEDVRLIQQSTAALELDINSLHLQSQKNIDSV